MIHANRYAGAVNFAVAAHAGQVRKNTQIPYVSHPLAVSALVLEFGGDEDQAIGALLHDVVEDCGITIPDIEEQFGLRIARIVLGCTDGIPDANGVKMSWRPRKEGYIATLATKDLDTLLVVACDKLHNARSIESDLGGAAGMDVFKRFTGGVGGTVWYYDAMRRALLARMPGHPVVDALSVSIGRIRNLIFSLDMAEKTRA